MGGRTLFSAIRRDPKYGIRPAEEEDREGVERLMQAADRHYLALEWWTVQEWLGSPTLLLALDDRARPRGLMLTVADAGPIGWVRAIFLAARGCLAPLFRASAQILAGRGSTGLAALGDEPWMVSELEGTGFEEINRVVTLRCEGVWPRNQGPPGLRVRAATATDLEGIRRVDRAAFPPMWWYSHQALERALGRAVSFDVAYLEGTCVGYQVSTLRNGRGHIVRLATHPDWQRRGISRRLLGQAMTTLERSGARQLTVNTQENNLASLKLYRRFGFERTGRPWTVWFKTLEQR